MKPGAPKGNQNAAKSRKYSGTFPAFLHYPEAVEQARELAKRRKLNLSGWMREAVDEKLEREISQDPPSPTAPG